MPHISVRWEPLGVKRLSLKNFQVFPLSPQKQLSAGLFSVALVVVGSLAVTQLPIPNLNLLVCVLVGYFLAERVHPHPLVGPLLVAATIAGLSWGLVMFVPDPMFDLPAVVMLGLATNLFVSMSAGALLALVFRMKYA